jgi:hypothetical protein
MHKKLASPALAVFLKNRRKSIEIQEFCAMMPPSAQSGGTRLAIACRLCLSGLMASANARRRWLCIWRKRKVANLPSGHLIDLLEREL